jgi:hydroxymethylbilane synthase
MLDRVAGVLPPETFIPAVGQGCVAVECRTEDVNTVSALKTIDHVRTRHDVEVERAFLAELGSGCSLPVGAHAADGLLRTFLADLATGESFSDEIALVGDSSDRDTSRRAALVSLAALE